jgi:hypothetical protein
MITGFPDRNSITEDRITKLRREMVRQSGIDLFIILASLEKTTILSSQKMQKILSGGDSMTHPELPLTEDPIFRTVIIESGMDTTGFRRLPSGSYYCSIHEREICEITSALRNHRILSIIGRSYQINSESSPLPYIPPDRAVLQYFPTGH